MTGNVLLYDNKPKRHHYIPVFYLKRWSGPDGRLCEFSRPFGPRVKPRMTHPTGTGFEERLYSIRDADPHVANILEERFFQVTDTQAARILERFERTGLAGEWSGDDRSAWSRFLISLVLRAPSDIAALRAHWDITFSEPDADAEQAYQDQRSISDAPTFREHLKSMPLSRSDPFLFDAFVPMIDNIKIGTRINGMFWSIANTGSAKFEFLTSDRPVVRRGLNDPGGHIALPIGPRKLFVASSKATYDQFKKMNVNDLVRQVNREVVEHAEKLVFGSSDAQLRFVSNRLGAEPQPGLLRVRERKSTRPPE
ncbi:DUF4238 domain-containing protein [Mesorhizobium sp. M4B.F.Ca.ET.169.01.1.1]|uniref:DUF4238 domain-containing protein n=1 Tax=Mesorhizobium sp. M4B.F.Ca.ET.169.01.1.1 TaxID=2563949 RepID=UPI001675707C|nr:DUF4238 domain-containing protein [Mesorhizobium sp. M4B.F.Ca.ET.169.01.1.1]